jgi:hypothetical protein
MKNPLRLIPDNIIKHYGLHEKAVDGYVYMEIRIGFVRPPTSPHPCQQTPQTPTGTPWIIQTTIHAQPLEIQFTTHLVQPVRGQLRHQIYW